ncbi:IS110 family transposase [Nocardia terpenica]|uniref:IS110 family transposase n=1 Tax=Nocardia terpenica TaxID=455432 RepID=UPI002B4AE5C1|nr:transposase [Nocardia terpenica]
MPQIWAGVDIGKTHHHCVVLDAGGKRLLSRRMLNDELELLALLADVMAIDEDAVWAVDVTEGMATLLISVLFNHGQQLLYLPGLAVNRASVGYRGTGKTDCGHDVRGVLPVAGPKDRSASCLLDDVSATGRTPFAVFGRVRCGLIGA